MWAASWDRAEDLSLRQTLAVVTLLVYRLTVRVAVDVQKDQVLVAHAAQRVDEVCRQFGLRTAFEVEPLCILAEDFLCTAEHGLGSLEGLPQKGNALVPHAKHRMRIQVDDRYSASEHNPVFLCIAAPHIKNLVYVVLAFLVQQNDRIQTEDIVSGVEPTVDQFHELFELVFWRLDTRFQVCTALTSHGMMEDHSVLYDKELLDHLVR